jgi:hypothetical protein
MLDERLAFLRVVAQIGGWASLLEIDALRGVRRSQSSMTFSKRERRELANMSLRGALQRAGCRGLE